MAHYRYMLDHKKVQYFYDENRYYTATIQDNGIVEYHITSPDDYTDEQKGTVELLWDTFGGSINSKGYKVLDPHIRAIYGDSITPQRAEQIYQRLEEKGFAANNVVLGAGSFSFTCLEENGKFYPFTRDTFGVAIKCTYGQLKDGTEIQIFKNPKTDTGHFKKSQKGLCYVYRNEDGMICYQDEYTSETIPIEGNILDTVFKNGRMVKEYTLNEIRNILHKETGGF